MEILRELGQFPQCSQAGGFIADFFNTVWSSTLYPLPSSCLHDFQNDLCCEVIGKTSRKEIRVWIPFGKIISPSLNLLIVRILI